jgi:DHA1 family multidrug resistance protein-like MFS transporter
MLNSLGIGWASSILGFISVAMVPLPFILQRVSMLLGLLSVGLNLVYNYLLIIMI